MSSGCSRPIFCRWPMPSTARRMCVAGTTISCIRRCFSAARFFSCCRRSLSPRRCCARRLPSPLWGGVGGGGREVCAHASTLATAPPDPPPYPPPQGGRDYATFDRRIVTLLAFGPGLAMIALIAVSGRGTFAMWGYPLWLFVGLWIVLMLRAALDRARLTHVIAHWGVVFAIFAIVFLVNYSVLPLIDHRYRAVFYPGNTLAATLTQRFHDATGNETALRRRRDVGRRQSRALFAGPARSSDRRPAAPRAVDRSCRSAQAGRHRGVERRRHRAPAAAVRRRRRQCRSRRAVRSADAPRLWRAACRLGDPEAAVRFFFCCRRSLSPRRCGREQLPSPLWGGVGGGDREVCAQASTNGVLTSRPPTLPSPTRGEGILRRIRPPHRERCSRSVPASP